MFAMVLALSEGSGNIINPDGSLVVILILFMVFVFALNRILFRPVGRVLDERQTRTEGAANEARAARRRYDAKLAEYEATIRQARTDAYRKSEQERAAGLEERRKLIDAAKQDANDLIAKAKGDIEVQASGARASLEAEARQLAEQISRTVLGRSVGGGGY